jgi:hypothetical protein
MAESPELITIISVFSVAGFIAFFSHLLVKRKEHENSSESNYSPVYVDESKASWF